MEARKLILQAFDGRSCKHEKTLRASLHKQRGAPSFCGRRKRIVRDTMLLKYFGVASVEIDNVAARGVRCSSR